MTKIPQSQLGDWKRFSPNSVSDAIEIIDALITAYEQSQRDLEGARKALRPFAEKAKLFGYNRYDVLEQGYQKCSFRIVDLRAAAKELEGET